MGIALDFAEGRRRGNALVLFRFAPVIVTAHILLWLLAISDPVEHGTVMFGVPHGAHGVGPAPVAGLVHGVADSGPVVRQLADGNVGIAEPVAVILRVLVDDATLHAEAVGGHVCDYPLVVPHGVRASPDCWGAMSEGGSSLCLVGRSVSISARI